MWLVIELRLGDIAQTWAMTQTKSAAYQEMQELMDNLHNDDTSWWKIIYAEDPVIINPISGEKYYVAINVDWATDNKCEFVRIFDQLCYIPHEVRHSQSIWVDQVRFNPN